MSRLTLYKRGQWWHARGTIQGQRIRKSLGTNSRQTARKLADEYEKQIWQGYLNDQRATRTFERAALSYLELGGDHRFARKVIEHFNGIQVDDIAPADIQRAALKLYPNAGPGTRNRQGITPAQAIINHAHELGWCRPIRVKRFPVPKQPKKRAVDSDWLEAFIQQADEDNKPHLGTAVLFMNQTAARRTEAAELTGEYFFPEEKLAILKKTKTDEYAPAYLTERLVQRMQELKPQPGKPIFKYKHPTSFAKAMKAVCKNAGIEYRTTHQAGRHSFGTNAIAGGSDVKSAMDAGRWKSASLFLETYVHSDEAGRKVATLMEKLAQN